MEKHKHIVEFLFVLFFISWLCLFTAVVLKNNESYELIEIVTEPIPLYLANNELEENPYEWIEKAIETDLNAIESIDSSLDWYIAYRNVVNKYAYIIDPPETVYDYFTDDEIYLIQRTVETECFDGDFDSKCHVANVIFNRIEDPEKRFGKTVEEVITSEKQFAYGRKNISESTKIAVEYAFEIVDTTNGCIGFHSNKKTNTFNGWKYVFTDSIGHNFYKEKENI